MNRKIKKVCVYCASSPLAPKVYLDAAKDCAEALVREGFEIVYGGGSLGLMGAVANAALAAGGKVTGVVPRQFTKEVVLESVSEKILVGSMSERKLKMIELSDAFVALPGGYGTLDEITETLTLLHLGVIDKPSIFLNTNNYYKDFFNFLENAVREKIITRPHKEMALLAENSSDLIKQMISFKRPEEELFWHEK